MRDTTVAPETVRSISGRLTFRDNHLRFRKFPPGDNSVYPAGAWHDACAYGAGILRVCTSKVSGAWKLFYQYAGAPNAFTNPLSNHWPDWIDTGIEVEPWSNIAVEDGRVFYQAVNGNVCYADFDGAALGPSVVLLGTPNKPYGFAPVSKTEIYLQYKAAPDSPYSCIQYRVIGGAVVDWPGRLYGVNPDYLAGFDAVRVGGRDRIYFTDEEGKRTLYITRPLGQALFSDVRQLIPLDVVDDTSSFVVGGASVLAGKVFLSGVLKRDANFPMHVFSYEVSDDHYSLGRELFIRSGQTRETPVTFSGDPVIFPMPAGKLILVDDILWYVCFGGCYYAYATQLVGVDREDFKLSTSDFSSLKISSACNQMGVLIAGLATSLQTALARPGCELTAEIGYGSELAQIGVYDVTVDSGGCEQTCKNNSLMAQPLPLKRLAQWEPDANYDYWSQTKVGARPADLTQLIRATGQWDGDPLRLDKLNVDGYLYAVDRPSRNQLVRAKFRFPSGSSYTPEFGVCLNFYGDSDVGMNAIVAYYSGGKVYLKVLRGDDFIATLGQEDVTAAANTWYWLSAEFHDCHIRVRWGTIVASGQIAWSELINVTYQQSEPPWVRDDFIGRGGLYVKNITPHAMSYPFSSSEMIVPLESNADFPLADKVLIDQEIIEYQGKSWPTRQVGLLPAPGDSIVGNLGDPQGFVPFAHRNGAQISAAIQTFPLPANYFVNGVNVFVRKLEGETDDLTVAIYQGPKNEKRPVGVKIASCQIANEDIGTTAGWITANFGTPMFLNKVNKYWLVLSQSNNPGDPTNPGFEIGYNNTLGIQGAGYTFNEDADQWIAKNCDYLFSLLGSTSVNAWTIILSNLVPPTYVVNGQTYVDASRYNDMALIVTEGAGQWEMFKVVGYGGKTEAGNYILFVDRDPANVVGDNSVFDLAPTLKVKTRGVTVTRWNGVTWATVATYHGRSMVSLWRDLSPECEIFRYYSSEKDMRLEDIVAELAAKAGVEAVADKEMPLSQAYGPGAAYSPVVQGKNAIVRFKAPASEWTYPEILFRCSQLDRVSYPSDGYSVALDMAPGSPLELALWDNQNHVQLDAIALQLPDGLDAFNYTWVTVSIFEEHVSVWLDGYFLYSFNLQDYGDRPDSYGLANCFYLDWPLEPAEVLVDWSQCDQLKDNYIFDMGQNGMGLLADLVKERRVFFQDNQMGQLRLFRDRIGVVNPDGEPYKLAALASSNHTDAEFASRIRLVGAEIAEGFDRAALAEYGNVFRLKYSQMLDYEEEHIEEVQRSLVDAVSARETYSLVGAFDPRLEVNDVIMALVDGVRSVRVAIDAMEVNLSLSEDSAICDMQLETHLHIPYDGGADIVVNSLASPLDWSDGLEDPGSGGRGLLLYRTNGTVEEFPCTPAGLVSATQALWFNDTLFIPAGELEYTQETELVLPMGASLIGAGKYSTVLTGKVKVKLYFGASLHDLAVESSDGKLLFENIHCAVEANGNVALRSCRLSLATSGKHAAAFVQYGGQSVLNDTDLRAKASGNVGTDPAEAACILNIHWGSPPAVRVNGGELVSSDLVVASQQHPPVSSKTIYPAGVSISGAVQVENT